MRVKNVSIIQSELFKNCIKITSKQKEVVLVTHMKESVMTATLTDHIFKTEQKSPEFNICKINIFPVAYFYHYLI